MTTAATFVIVALVVATLPITYFRDEATAAGGRPAWWLAGRIARNVAGVVLIVVGILLSIPGVPGQGLLTLLAGVVLVDFPGRHRAARAIARWRGVLLGINRLRALLSDRVNEFVDQFEDPGRQALTVLRGRVPQ